MDIKLDPSRRERVTVRLQQLFAKEFDDPLSDFRASEIVDLMLKTLGPAIYNQAVQDVRAHMQGKLDDLDGEIFADGDA
ncbi:MAG: DUF2164 domain-containing protein [Hyphomonadaceae bacterium]|nr:DUF2164 domain-containing protein [Hyphomonadaceae bacterium]